jgi:hypothetical protein
VVSFPIAADDSRAPQAPTDAALVLWVELRSFGLAETFEWIHRKRCSGLLRLVAGDHRKAVYFHEGDVVFATSNQSVDRLGPSLVRSGTLSADQVQAANRISQAHQRFGKTLVQLGYLRPQELWRALRGQVEEIVYSMFLYERGQVAFWEGEFQPDNMVRLNLETPELIDAAVRWREELERWIESISHSGVRIEAVAEKCQTTEGWERQFVDALEAPSRFATLRRRVGVDVATAARALLLLRRAGAICIERVEEDPESTQRVRDEGSREQLRSWLTEADRCVGAFVTAIEAAESSGAIHDRLATAVEEVAARYPGVLARVCLPAVGNFPLEALQERARELPTEVLGDVYQAVCALVDYLEFETKNQAAIEGAQALFENSEALRARIRR